MKERGITLLALIITIIIMLILAAVTFGAINGGLFEYAGEAKRKTDIFGEKEILTSAFLITKDESKTGRVEQNSFQKHVDKSAGENTCVIYDIGDKLKAHFNDTDNWYIIDNDGNINEWRPEEETNGIYIATLKKTTLQLDGAILLSPIQTETPSTATNLNYIWSSSNPNVAIVTVDGILKCGTEIGTTTITCKGANNTEATCEVSTTAKIEYTNNGMSNSTANGETASSNNPIIPVGYSAITTKDAKWNISGDQTDVDNGLVIMDDNGNQFVWIPVPNVIYDGTTEITSGTYTPMAELKSGSQTNYSGIFYSFEGTTATRFINGNDYEPGAVTKSDYIENDEEKGYALIKRYITGMDGKTNSEIKTAWGNQLQQEYNQAVNKTLQYGGFWISRYEISYDINKKRMASIAGIKSATNLEETTKTWYSMYQKIKDYSNNSNYSSAMPWWSQYSAMWNWMAKNGVPVGNNQLVTGASKNITKICGSLSYKDKVKNICDLYGSGFEWTQGIYKYSGSRKICSPSYRVGNKLYYQNNASPHETYECTSRITLCIN